MFTSIFRVLFLCDFLLLSAAIDQMGIGEATPALQGPSIGLGLDY